MNSESGTIDALNNGRTTERNLPCQVKHIEQPSVGPRIGQVFASYSAIRAGLMPQVEPV